MPRAVTREGPEGALTASNLDHGDTVGPSASDLDDVARRLAMGAAADTPPKTVPTTPAAGSPTRTRSPSRIRMDLEEHTEVGTAGTHPSIPKESPIESLAPPKRRLPRGGQGEVRYSCTQAKLCGFETAQKDVLYTLLTLVSPGDGALRIQEPLPSAPQLNGGDYPSGNVEEGDHPMELIQRRDRGSRKATSTTDTINEEHQDQEGGSEHKVRTQRHTHLLRRRTAV